MADTPAGIEIIRSPERLAEIGPAWTALWRRAGRSVFQSHAWIAAWWSTLPANARPRLAIGLAWAGADLAAVLPLVVQRRRGLRVLEWAAKDHSDYCDALARLDLGDGRLLQRLWSATTAATGFDLAYLSHLQPDAVILPVLSAREGGALRLSLNHRREASLRVPSAWANGQAWFESLPKKVRQNHRRGRKLLSDAGPARFREIGAEEPLDPILDRLVELKRDWLVRSGNTSSLLADGAAPFRALVRVLAEEKLLRIFVLESDGAIAAAAVNLVERGRMMAFFAAYDVAHERASVGTVLMTDYMMAAFDEGIEEIDFLCGGEAYKLRFATRSVDLVAMMGGRSLAGRAAVLADSWIPAARALNTRMRQAWRSRRPAAASAAGGFDGSQPRGA